MADTKITALTAITTVDPANDVLPIVDVSDTSMAASGTTKKITTNQILGASGTATLASATITGDLTVRTNKLAVTSTGVGVGTASPLGPFHLVTTAAGYSDAGYFENSQAAAANVGPRLSLLGVGSVAMATIDAGWNAAANTDSYLRFLTRGTSSVAERYRIASDGVATWSNVGGVAGTAMTLNSTGLIRGASSADIITTESTTLTNIGNIGAAYGTNTGTYFAIKVGAANGIVELKADARTGAYPPIVFTTGSTERMRIDSSGNVGIGVTPSAWNSTFKALQMGLGGSAYSQTGFNSVYLGSNTFVDSGGNTKYINTDKATYYRQYDGIHSWFNAVSGTAGNAFTATQAMTLESTGSLVLGAAAVATTATDGFLYIPGCAGTPTGTPTAKTGRVPLVVDTTNNKLYFYSGGAWVAAN